MNERGREAMRHWRMWRPRAYDALDDPIAHFTTLGEQFEREVETEYAALLRQHNYDEDPPDGYVADLRNDAIAIAEATMRGPEEPDLLFEVPSPPSGWERDPAQKWSTGGWPAHPDHPLWNLVDDPSIPALDVAAARAEWWATVPAEPEIQPVGEPLPAEVLDEAWTHRAKNPHALRPRFPEPARPCEWLREDDYGVVVRTEHAILNYAGRFAGEAHKAHQFLQWAHDQRRPWATDGCLVWDTSRLVLPRLVSDGSGADPTALREMADEIGHLEPESQYVVIDGQPMVIDYGAAGWTSLPLHPRPRTAGKPLLFIDVDGCLSPYNKPDELFPGFTNLEMWNNLQIHLPRLRRLFALADRYELVWATTWYETAHFFTERFDLPELPYIHFNARVPWDVEPYDCPKVPSIVEYAAGRPFATLDDWHTFADAQRLVAEHDCLVIRTAPRRGIEDHHLDALEAWAERPQRPAGIDSR